MIKQIGRENIPECVSVIRESFMTVADELGFTAQNAPGFTAFSTNEEKLNWQYENETRSMFACFDNEKIVGYYSLLYFENNECELNNLCVLPEFRHRKIGEELLNNAFAQAKKSDCTKMKIGIVEENIRLRRWYEKHGFTHTGTEKFDFFPFTCGYMEIEI